MSAASPPPSFSLHAPRADAAVPPRGSTRSGDPQPPPVRPSTRALIGRHSKDRLVSVFLEERRLLVTADKDGIIRWPTLSGLVTIDSAAATQLLAENYAPYAEIQCVLLYRTALGAVLRKIVYSKSQRLISAEAAPLEGSTPGRLRYPFTFNFTTDEFLPPSFCVDATDVHEGLPIGLHWECSACLGRQVAVAGDGMAGLLSMDGAGVISNSDAMAGGGAGGASSSSLAALLSIQRRSAVSLNFVVEHRHTGARAAQLTPALTAAQTLRPSLFSFNRSAQPETAVEASIAGSVPLCTNSGDVPLKVNVRLTKLSKSHKVQRVRLTAKQVVTVRLPSQQQLQYRGKVAILEDLPAPRYDPAHESGFEAVYDLFIGTGLPDRPPKKGKMPAQLLPLDWNQRSKDKQNAHVLPAVEFVASTVPPPAAHTGEDQWEIEVKYVLKVDVTLADLTGTFGSRERDLSVSLPFILTGDHKDEPTSANPITFGSQQVRRDSSTSSTSSTIPLAPDALLPVLGETLDDLEVSLADISILRAQWRVLRQASSNCVGSADHASEVLRILDQLEGQLRVFGDSFASRDGSVRWPKNPVPFNMLVLETELMARAAPNALAEGEEEDEEGEDADEVAQRRRNVHPALVPPAPPRAGAVDVVLACTDTFFAAGKAVVLAWIASRGSAHDDAEAEAFAARIRHVEATAAELRRALGAVVAGKDRDRGGGAREKGAMAGEEDGDGGGGGGFVSGEKHGAVSEG
ncbi:hypothetical protein HDU87_008319 [Geranomyces variabilis]|uniref:Uncharacterized protein n=1 Tax=Geranomyces variabilis TaxID=109894 RepID=A0AAD5XMS2_9FUNG|nr:hypothetical protein HDU87_008319 [Geranomyces variabilis]